MKTLSIFIVHVIFIAFAACIITVSAQDTVFTKHNRFEVEMIEEGFLYIDAEDFDNYGGWRMDNQFVHLMGSPYLIATGIGKPVEDAKTLISIPKRGKYNIWVRARNWEEDYTPGRFKVMVNNRPLNKEFGAAKTNDWTWEYGGMVKLSKGQLDLALHDLTGFYGRCDAIILTTDTDYIPPENKDEICKERARLLGLSLEPQFGGSFDVIVVGGGSAGVPAAIAAARQGAKTALIQDRPVLGGNSSVELGVGLNGSGHHHPGWRETGIIEEVSLTRIYNDYSRSEAFMDLCKKEKNLTVFLNQHVFEARMENNSKINGVRAVSTLTGLITEYQGKMFIDCTGDGWLGYYAGAESRYGRESSNEFGEDRAPEKADSITMSGCLMSNRIGTCGFQSRETDHPVEFNRPPWVRKIEILESPGRHFGNFKTGSWWMEHPGDVNDLWGAEQARDELIKVSLSFWDYIKNRSRVKEEANNYELAIIPITNAKRETRRLEGDYILTQHDVQEGREFPDRIAYAGWPLDIHHPEGIYSGAEGSFDYQTHVPINTIPYRCTYSKNINNLFMAGRCGSFSHVALGSVRVQRTLATIGQAAGTAASICVQKDIQPRKIYQDHIDELQQLLLKYDQSIPDLVNKDPEDQARNAYVTASSTAKPKESNIADLKMSQRVLLDVTRSTIIPVNNLEKVNNILIYLESKKNELTTVSMNLRAMGSDNIAEEYHDLGNYSIEIEPNTKRWFKVPVNLPIKGNITFLRISLSPQDQIFWPLVDLDYKMGGRTIMSDVGERLIKGEFHALATDPGVKKADIKPENVINGQTRLIESGSSIWISDPKLSFPQWIELIFEKPSEINTIHLTFDTDLSLRRTQSAAPEACVKDYKLSALSNGQWITVAEITDNYLRHRIHNFNKIRASKIRLAITATNGALSARVYEIRAYNE